MNSKGSTALYDAIYAGLAKVRDGTNPRKALVVVSDGYDNHSRYSGKNVREAVKETDVQLYLIGNEGDGGLTALAESIGWAVAFATRRRTFELGNICNEIVGTSRTNTSSATIPQMHSKTESGAMCALNWILPVTSS